MGDVAVKINCRREKCGGNIIFGGAEIIFFDKNNKKSVVEVSYNCDKCSSKSRKVTILHSPYYCNCCNEDIYFLIDKAKIKVINFLPEYGSIVFRITIVCEKGTTNEVVIFQKL